MEAGAPGKGDCDKGSSVPAPPGVVMVAPPEVPRNAGRKAKGRAKCDGKERGPRHYRGWDQKAPARTMV